jgi:hypothetical protein
MPLPQRILRFHESFHNKNDIGIWKGVTYPCEVNFKLVMNTDPPVYMMDDFEEEIHLTQELTYVDGTRD